MPLTLTLACQCSTGTRMPGGRSTRKPRSADRYSIDDELSFVSHQMPSLQARLPAVRETPRSSVGNTSVEADSRPKVNLSPGRTRHVPVSNMTISSTPHLSLRRGRARLGHETWTMGTRPHLGRRPLGRDSP